MSLLFWLCLLALDSFSREGTVIRSEWERESDCKVVLVTVRDGDHRMSYRLAPGRAVVFGRRLDPESVPPGMWVRVFCTPREVQIRVLR